MNAKQLYNTMVSNLFKGEEPQDGKRFRLMRMVFALFLVCLTLLLLNVFLMFKVGHPASAQLLAFRHIAFQVLIVIMLLAALVMKVLIKKTEIRQKQSQDNPSEKQAL